MIEGLPRDRQHAHYLRTHAAIDDEAGVLTNDLPDQPPALYAVHAEEHPPVFRGPAACARAVVRLNRSAMEVTRISGLMRRRGRHHLDLGLMQVFEPEALR